MACLSAPKIPTPAGLSLLLPTLTLTPPNFALGLCCTFETPPVPGFPIVIPLNDLVPAGAGVILAPVVSVILAAIDQLNALLDQIPPLTCPLE